VLRLIAAPQVYGGGVSVVVHPYLWSASSFYGSSTASAGSTIVSGLSALFSDCFFANSRAQTQSGGELTAARGFVLPCILFHFLY
jgi:lysozyme family protein